MSDMADAPPASSQDSHYEKYKIPIEKEDVSSSPLGPPPSRSSTVFSSQKIKKPPTVTPKRFTKFFTPRNTLSSRGGRQSKASRQLQDITKNGVNRRSRSSLGGDAFLKSDHDDFVSSRPLKRRKFSVDLSSSPLQSSPLRHVQAAQPDVAPLSPTLSEAETLPDLLADWTPFPTPIRRLPEPGRSRRILERSFGGLNALPRSQRAAVPCADARAETANFTTSPADLHNFRGTSLPFCTAACNTNSLVAFGDEEGSVRLVDSSKSASFNTSHVKFRVHHNAVMDVAFCSDDYMLATASGDQTARVVDMQSQQTVCILSGHKSSVKQVRFQPNDDNMITTSARDGTVRLWDLRCGGKSAIQNFRASMGQQRDADGKVQPDTRYSQELHVGYGHRSSNRPFEADQRNELSITSFEHLPQGREHLIVTASEVDASIKVWDLRNAGRRSPVPLSSTPVPETHTTRHYGINSMALSGDGARLYTVCRDATIYAYSTNQLVLGYAPEVSSGPSRRRMLKEPKQGLGPLYGFKHPKLQLGTFYVKASLRPAKDDRGELLAIGNTARCPLLIPTDERYLPRGGRGPRPDILDEDEMEDLPILPQPAEKRSVHLSQRIFEHGTPLDRAHSKEVTSLTWTTEGNLVSVSDDFSARCWREDAQRARELRQMGEGGGGRWRCGWAQVDSDWDEED